MRKRMIRVSSLILFLIIFFASSCFAANGYDFEVNYTGKVLVNHEKPAEVVLVGDGTSNGYSNVQIKVDISGPSTPQLLATDSTGTQHDIAQLGYWGPDTGFAIPADVRNVTPITALFDKAGNYTITLSLIDKANSDAIITTRDFGITVTENTPANDIANQVNDIVNNPIENAVNGTVNDITELPKTGASIPEIIISMLAIVGVLLFAAYRVRNHG